MKWVAGTLHTTSEHGASSITTADAHTSTASSGLNDASYLNWPVRFTERRIASTLHTTLEHGVSSITIADAHTSVASGRLN